MTEHGDATDERRERRRNILAAAVAVEGGLAALALALGAAIEVPPGDSVDWSWRSLVWGIAASVPMLLASTLLLRLPLPGLQGLRDFLKQVVVPMLNVCTLTDLAAISLLAGVGEEMLFRGVLQPAFSLWAEDPWMGILAASLLFGLTHALTPTYVALAGVAGVYLGALMLWTGSLVAPIVAHSVYDFVLLWILIRPDRKPIAKEFELG